jgi:hypothetical protein
MAVDAETPGQLAFARQAPIFAEPAGRYLGSEDLLDLPPHGNPRATFELRARRGIVRCHGAVIPVSSNIRCDMHCSARPVMEI